MATFRSDARTTGVDAAETVRRRLQDAYSAKELYVVPKRLIDATLAQSGYKTDSALSAADLMELGRQVHADEVLDAYASKSPDGVRIEPRILLKRASTILSQPLPAAEGKNAGDAAKQLERSLDAARKSLPLYRSCENELRDQKYDVAASTARGIVQSYPNSTLGRLCLLSAFIYAKSPPDSVIRVADELLGIDSLSLFALINGAVAYHDKGNIEKAIEYNVRLYHADPFNAATIESLVDDLMKTAKPERALAVLDEVITNSPTDARWLRKKLAVLLAAKQYRPAIAFSDTLAAVDSSALTKNFFERMGAAAMLDSQPQLAVQIYERGLQKFPNDAGLWLATAQAHAKSGQAQSALAAAARAVGIDPRIENGNGYLYVLGLQIQLNQLDSAKVTAGKAVAAGADKERVASALLAVVLADVRRARDSGARADWETALKTAQEIDAVAPSSATKLYIGVAAYSVGSDIANGIAELGKQVASAKPAAARDLRARICADLKLVEDNFATASIAAPAGGAFDGPTAAAILSGIQQYDDFLKSAKKAYCR